MTRSQLIFSLGSGLAIASAGFALASSQFADWGLFWVGMGVTGVTLVNQFKSGDALTPELATSEA